MKPPTRLQWVNPLFLNQKLTLSKLIVLIVTPTTQIKFLSFHDYIQNSIGTADHPVPNGTLMLCAVTVRMLKARSDAWSCWLMHCGLMTPYGDRDLGQHWLRQWLVAWRHQVITWTNVDLPSARCIGIHLITNLQETLQPSIATISWKITFLKFVWNLQGANELTQI